MPTRHRRTGTPRLDSTLDFLRLLWSIQNCLQSTSKHMSARLGITGPQRLALRIVARFPGVAPKEVADLLHLHPSTITGVLQRLEDKGLLTRQRHATDGRRAHLHARPAAKRFTRSTRGTVEAAVACALGRMPRGFGRVKGFALDFCDSIGFDIPRLAPATIDALKIALPAFASLDNPVDVTAQVLRDLTLWTKTAEALLADPGMGSLCIPMVAGSPKFAMDKVQALAPAIEAHGKPAVIAVLGDDFPVPPEFLAAFREKGIPVLRSTERALRALAHATAYGAALAAAPSARSASTRLSCPARNAARVSRQGVSGGARHPGAARRARARRGRGQGDRAAHRLSGRAQGAGGSARAQERCGRGRAQHRGCGRARSRVGANARAWRPRNRVSRSTACWSRRWRPSGIEVIVGARRDPEWGPVVLVGLGGIWTEALDDVRLMPADLSAERIAAEIGRLKGARVLRGLRGAPAADIAALAGTVARVGALMRRGRTSARSTSIR